MNRPEWAPLDIDLATPSASRIYDFYLGGSHNFEVDRQIARRAVAEWPRLPALMRENRAFLRRAVRYLLDQGITQFIDIGSGIPTEGNVDEVALAGDPAARVVYVDLDPVAVAHSRAILAGNSQTLVIRGDLRRPAEVLDNAAVTEFIDFDQPIGLIFAAVLHFVSDADDPAGVMTAYADRMPASSFVVISHATTIDDPERAATQARMAELYRDTPTPITMRTPAEILPLFGPFELIEPGLVQLSQWHRDRDRVEEPIEDTGYGGVGRKA